MTSVCEGWRRNGMQHLCVVGKNSGPALSYLCIKVHEILSSVEDPL